MRNLRRMFFTGGQELMQFEKQWNKSTKRKGNVMIGGAIKLWEDHSDFPRFMNYFKSYSCKDIVLENWEIEVVYSDEEFVGSALADGIVGPRLASACTIGAGMDAAS